MLALAALVVAIFAGGSSALAASTRRHAHRARGVHRHAKRELRRHGERKARRRGERKARRHGCEHTGLMPNRFDVALVRAATLCLVNRERIAIGDAPLRPNARLRRAAQAHSDSMAFGDYFEHFGGGGPGGGTPLARIRAAGYISSSRVGYEIGENIAWGTHALATPRAIVAAWMASPGHRANILDPHYRETGIGVVAHPPVSLAHGQAGAVYTQDFGAIIAG